MRKTYDEHQIHGHYCYGWEEVTASTDRKDALALLKNYRDNESNISFKIVKK